jgi:hypothetical protein
VIERIAKQKGFRTLMNDHDVSNLLKAASERQLAVVALQEKYEQSESMPTEQLVLDMGELLATERVVLDAIITLFVKLGERENYRVVTVAGAGADVSGWPPSWKPRSDCKPCLACVAHPVSSGTIHFSLCSHQVAAHLGPCCD